MWKKIEKKTIIILIILLLIVFLNACNTKFVLIDYSAYLEHTNALKYNPYVKNDPYVKYPAFYFIFMGLLGFFGVNTIFSIKLVFGLFDVGIFFLLKRISKVLSPKKDETSHWLVPILYFFFPIHWHFLKHGENDSISIFFLLVALDLFLRELYNFSALILSFGIMFKIFPIFFLIPISLYFLKKSKFKQIFYYWGIIGLFFILISLPFILFNYNSYFKGIFIHASRQSTGNSYAPLLDILYNSWFSLFGEISISYQFIIQIAVLSIYSILIYTKFENIEKNNFILISCLSFIIPSFITYQDNHTSIIRFLPFLLLYLFSDTELKKDRKKKLLLMFAAFFIIIFILVIVNQYWISDQKKFEIFIYITMLFFEIFYIITSTKYSSERKTKRIILLITIVIFEIAQFMEDLVNLNPKPVVYIFFSIRLIILYPFLFYSLFDYRKKKFGKKQF